MSPDKLSRVGKAHLPGRLDIFSHTPVRRPRRAVEAIFANNEIAVPVAVLEEEDVDTGLERKGSSP